MKTFFGLIKDYNQGDAAVSELVQRGFDHKQINVVLLEHLAKNSMEAGLNSIKVDKSEELGQPGAHGLDGLLGGEQAVTIPDVGRVYAAGELANLLTNTASVPGEVDGGLKAALVDFSLSEEAAAFYQEGVKDGGLLFFIRTEDERAKEAAGILRAHNAEQVMTTAGA